MEEAAYKTRSPTHLFFTFVSGCTATILGENRSSPWSGMLMVCCGVECVLLGCGWGNERKVWAENQETRVLVVTLTQTQYEKSLFVPR